MNETVTLDNRLALSHSSFIGPFVEPHIRIVKINLLAVENHFIRRMNTSSPENLPSFDLTWIRWLLDSYAFWLRCELIDRTGTIEEQSERLYFSPFVVTSHAKADDPVLNYGNQRALRLWEGTWEEFTATPSRLTAEPLNQIERAQMLNQVTTHGFITNYQGTRISRTGRRFFVKEATVWNVLDEHGTIQGQAATFSRWEYLKERRLQ